MAKPFNKHALKRAIWTSIARLIGVGFGAGAGSMIYRLIGGAQMIGWMIAVPMVLISFTLMTFAEYEKECD
jgi:predicted MFS family arabinose efflux permease